MRQVGLEWLWRIKEEPHLWQRYAKDAFVMLRYFFTRVVPLNVIRLRQRHKARRDRLEIQTMFGGETTRLQLSGVGTIATIPPARAAFSAALDQSRDIALDCSQLRYLDARFIGLLLMLRKECCSRDLQLRIENPSATTATILRLHGLEIILR